MDVFDTVSFSTESSKAGRDLTGVQNMSRPAMYEKRTSEFEVPKLSELVRLAINGDDGGIVASSTGGKYARLLLREGVAATTSAVVGVDMLEIASR
jgi:hypothetical protein